MKIDMNADNIAPPVATCIGNPIILCLIGILSTILIAIVNALIPLILSLLLVVSLVFCAVPIHRNRFVCDPMGQGWTPLFGATILSTALGLFSIYLTTNTADCWQCSSVVSVMHNLLKIYCMECND